MGNRGEIDERFAAKASSRPVDCKINFKASNGENTENKYRKKSATKHTKKERERKDLLVQINKILEFVFDPVLNDKPLST